MRRIAVIGSGISGLAAAWRLQPHADVTLFEAGRYFGGHTHTVDVTLDGPRGPVTHGVDTGFLVFNPRTYPNLVALFEGLDIHTTPSEMSFSVQVPGHGLEWSGSDLGGVFAQRRNLLRPAFWRLLVDLLRFNRLTQGIALRDAESELHEPIGDFLQRHRFGAAFRDWYFLPMLGCIWSCPTDQMLRFPVATMIRFCHNHGLIQIAHRPQWYTVTGGARHYVDKMLALVGDARLATPVHQVRRHLPGNDTGAQVATDGGAEHFDDVVFACHADQALALLERPTDEERAVLGRIRYQPNRAVLHTDTSLLPQRRRAWAAWNYERALDDSRERTAVCLHYLLNRLQPLPFERPVIVSLNPAREPRPQDVLGEFDYRHPVFDLDAIRAQQEVPRLQGVLRSWYCGAWTGYGFHEDGLKSGLDAARRLLDRIDADGAARSRRNAA
ncbi:FAD-dependent oxidoreductase [Schlegelella sp. S2-27]|uniref:FAD-dependent oxidoreductase n=1 Tax=Caldimonas mangrovi TaxID=2944811 RepID=A0ABT0YKH7_9BURK|nr:FAD-dependent oxidoreductase [Caldimonas mangrovi]MCM5679241.1 FAD-dependent oxidoreductase [Caldimonas mangrovi]